MAANQADPRLRFEAGKYEDHIVSVILLFQITLMAVVGVMGAGLLFLSVDFEVVIASVPVLLGVTGVAYLLNYLYEYE